MIQTTIQNSCAVDDYKRSGNVCLTAQCSELQCEYVILQYLSPKQPQSCGLLHILSIFKKKHAKKKIRMEKGEKGKAKGVPIIHRGGPRLCAWPRLSSAHHGAASCGTGCSVYGRFRGFFGVIPFIIDKN